jgi:hypothetical protein
MSNQNDTGFTLKPSIPQLFYDIIARIVPGVVIIGVLAVAAAGPEKSVGVIDEWLHKPGELYPSILLLIVSLFAVSYTLAIVFLGLCHVISKKLPKRFKPNSSHNDFPMRYDFIKSRDPDAGSRITKLTAERHMAEILTLGLCVSIFINVVNLLMSSSLSRWMLLMFLFIAVVGSLGALYYFINRQDCAIENYCDLYGYDDWKAEQEELKAKRHELRAKRALERTAKATTASLEAENGKHETSPAATVAS